MGLVKERKAEWEEEVPRLRAELAAEPDHEHRHFIEDEIRHGEQLLAQLGQVFPDEDPRKALLDRRKQAQLEADKSRSDPD